METTHYLVRSVLGVPIYDSIHASEPPQGRRTLWVKVRHIAPDSPWEVAVQARPADQAALGGSDVRR
eukprot:3050010-Alexandrium_andersonii.AAC.1